MLVLVVLFRQGACARGGHLGGNCRERQPILRKLRFLVTVNRNSKQAMRRFDCPPTRQARNVGAASHHSDLITLKWSLAEGRSRSACRRWPARRIIVATMKTACCVRFSLA